MHCFLTMNRTLWILEEVIKVISMTNWTKNFQTCMVRDLITSFAAIFFSLSPLVNSVASLNSHDILLSSASRSWDLWARRSTYIQYSWVTQSSLLEIFFFYSFQLSGRNMFKIQVLAKFLGWVRSMAADVVVLPISFIIHWLIDSIELPEKLELLVAAFTSS